MPFLPFISTFGNFKAKLATTCLVVACSLGKTNFCLLIILPKAFLFYLTLMGLSTCTFRVSGRVFFDLVNRSRRAGSLGGRIVSFYSQSISTLVVAFYSALLSATL